MNLTVRCTGSTESNSLMYFMIIKMVISLMIMIIIIFIPSFFCRFFWPFNSLHLNSVLSMNNSHDNFEKKRTRTEPGPPTPPPLIHHRKSQYHLRVTIPWDLGWSNNQLQFIIKVMVMQR